MRRRVRLTIAAASALLAAVPCAAQPPSHPAAPLPPIVAQQVRPAPAPPPPATAPFDAPLDQLAQIMGTLAFMRELCGDGDGAAWHDKMQALIDAEGKSGARAERLAGSYNRGFKDYQLTYRTCTPAARAVIDRFLDQGTRLARELSVRFGND